MARGQVNMADEAKLGSPIRATLEALAVQCAAGHRQVENRALSVDQCWLQALQFLVHLVNWLSTLLRCNGFARIQKAVVNQRGSNHQTVTMNFFWCSFDFGKCIGASSRFQTLSWSSLVVIV